MAAIASAGAGAWNSTTPNAPWPSGTVPVSGDTVTIGHAVSVPSGYTAVCGTSPTSDAGTVALTINAALTVTGTLKWQGPVRQGDATVTVSAGGTLTYDASGAATPATALYSWQIGQNNSQANALLVLNGSSGSRCTVNSVGNVQSGGFGNTGTNWVDGGRIEATYTDFSYMGAASTSGNFLVGRLASSVARHIFNHCTIDHCAMIWHRAFTADATFQFLNSTVTNPVNSQFMFQLTGQTAKTTGVREIKNSTITGVTYILTTAATATGFVITHNVFRNTPQASGTSTTMNFTAGTTVTTWDQNLFASNTSNTASDDSSYVPAGSLTNTYVYRNVGSTYSNPHPIYVKPAGVNYTFSGWIWEYSGTDDNGDVLEVFNDATSAATLTVQNNIFLPNAAGIAVGSFVNNVSGATQTNLKTTFDHNTCCVSGSGTNTYGVGGEAAGTSFPAGSIPSIRSNIAWRPASGAGLIAQSNSSATVSNGAVTAADYQCLYQVTGSIYGNPSNQFSGTPGTHDISANPQFVDSTRNIFSFDTGYLGHAVATAWATSTAYVVGDIRSSSDATFHASATYNFRCIAAHTSGATTKPGAGSAWATNWEPATIGYIETDIVAGTTYSAGANSLIGELVAWVKAGFAPTNASLQNAGHDSVTIGAVEFADTTAPTATATQIRDDGTRLEATLSETCATVVNGTGGFTIAGTAATVNVWNVINTTLLVDLTGTVKAGETITWSYSRATTTNDIADDPAGNFLADFGPTSVTNNSTVPAASGGGNHRLAIGIGMGL